MQREAGNGFRARPRACSLATNRKARRPAPPAGCKEAAVNGSIAWAAYWIPSLVLGVFTVSMLVMVAVAVRREDRRFSLYEAAPGPAARVTRRLTRFGASGLHVQPRDGGG